MKKSQILEKAFYKIPPNLEKKNIFIQIVTLNQTIPMTYFSTSLKVIIIENYGQVKVFDENDKPLTKVKKDIINDLRLNLRFMLSHLRKQILEKLIFTRMVTQI